MLRSVNIRCFIKYSKYSFSTVAPASANLKQSKDEKKADEKPEPTISDKSKLVAAAFTSLKNISNDSSKKGIRNDIFSATDVEALLSIVEKPLLSRSNALMILTTLTNWVNEGKVKLSDFEMDQRFIKLCRILGRSTDSKNKEVMGDLAVCLGVTAEEQAAKLISSVSLPQMVKILKTIGVRKRRSIPLLRSLSFNIANSSEKLDVKQASDILYSLAELNYPDEVLMLKVREDLRMALETNTTHSVVCSAIRSLGLLRYRDTELLDELFEWIMKQHFSLKTKHLLPLLFTLASLNYVPELFPRFYKVLEPHLNENKLSDINKFIDAAWSLVILQQYDHRVINLVMDPAFIFKLMAKYGSVENIDVSDKIHLIQVNSATKLFADSYTGSLLEENSPLYQISLSRRKEKQFMVDSIRDTLSNIVSKLDEYVEVDANSNMGFYIDFVCHVDKKSNFVKINSDHTNGSIKKIALMVCDYHDFCRGCGSEFTGSTALKHRLLSGLGYLVIPIPHTEYGCNDALMNKARYINEKIKAIITET